MELLNRLNNQFRKGNQQLTKRRNEWPIVKNFIIEVANDYIKEAAKEEYYEFMYVISDNSVPNLTINQSFVQIYVGSHPTGIMELNDSNNRNNGYKHIVESSGALSIVQEPRGGIFFLLFPSKSDVFTYSEEYITLNFFTSPNKIKQEHITEAIETYLEFTAFTSVHCNPTLWQKFKFWWIKFKVTKIALPFLKFLGIVSRVAISAHGLPPLPH